MQATAQKPRSETLIPKRCSHPGCLGGWYLVLVVVVAVVAAVAVTAVTEIVGVVVVVVVVVLVVQ